VPHSVTLHDDWVMNFLNIKNMTRRKIMGNMSNPSINRWGLNLFWYRYWFYDSKYFLSAHNDYLVNKLVLSYLNFGIMYPKNIFVHKYWFRRSNFNNYDNEHNSKYFRIMSFKNLITNEISYYNERIKVENIYQSRLWILKFQHWVLINFYCFNPLKKRYISDKKTTKHMDLSTYTFINKKHSLCFRRFKLLFFFILKKKFIINNSYFF
jgi:hypothetical protein